MALAARWESPLLEVQAGLDHWGGEARSMVAAADVADRDQDKSLVACTEEELGPADVLFNCAGVMYYTLVYTLGTQHPTLRFRVLLTNDAQEVRFEWVSGDRVLRD